MDIRPHTTKKHRAIGYYLKIVRDVVNSPTSHFKELYYIDLFCGDGECVVEATGKSYPPPVIESILKPASVGKICVHCFLNDLDSAKFAKMVNNTAPYSKFIDSYTQEDANACYSAILKKVPQNQFSIFVLDPTNHKDLKWSTIEGISRHQHTYYGGQVRRPEMILTLMTYSMLNHYRSKKYETISESLGTEAWLDEIEKNRKLKIEPPVETAFLNIFKSQLTGLGYEIPAVLPIESIDTGTTVYYLVWASNKSGSKLMQKRLVPYLNKLMKVAQKETEVEIKIAQAKKDGIPPLDKWMQAV